jgi:hypothetical protein
VNRRSPDVLFNAYSNGNVGYSSPEKKALVYRAFESISSLVGVAKSLHWWVYSHDDHDHVCFDIEGDEMIAITICICGEQIMPISVENWDSAHFIDWIDAFCFMAALRCWLGLATVETTGQGLRLSVGTK